MKLTFNFLQLALAVLLLAVSRQATSEPYIIAYNHDWAPFSYIDSEGNVQGILPRLMEELSRESSIAELEAVGLPWDRVSHAVRHGAASAFITFASRERLGFSEAIGPTIYELGQNPVVRSEASIDQGSIFQVKEIRYCQMVGDDWSTAFYGALGIQSFAARDSRACLNLIHRGRADVFLHPVPIITIRMTQMNLKGALRQFDQPAATMPFHLLWRKDVPERELQTARLLGRALSQLRQEKRWMPTIARIEQEAVTQCLGANKAIC
ncbi:MAG: transporter substrate-binding domain-containing protein [Gammaproteobacteria bacterium]